MYCKFYRIETVVYSTAFQEIYLVLRKVIIVGLATFLGPQERIKFWSSPYLRVTFKKGLLINTEKRR